MKRKILIIDDDFAVLEILNEWLSADGFQVKTMPNTIDVVEVINRFNPNIILLDFLLRGKNGGELCFQIKSDYRYGQLPVIIFSAFPQGVLSLDRYKCDLFVQKPFDLYQLEKQINQLILSQPCNLLTI